MAYLMMPGLLEKMSNPLDVRKLLFKDLKIAAGKPEVKFVVAKNYDVGGKPTQIFVVTEKREPFEKLFRDAHVQMSSGTATVRKEGGGIKIVLKKVKGQLPADTVSELMFKVFADRKIVCTTAGAERDEAQKDDPGGRAKPDAAALAASSHKRARAEGKIDWKALSTPDGVKRMTKLTMETAQYKKFADEFEKLAKRYKFADYKKVPVNIWRDLIRGLADSGYLMDKIPKVDGTESFILATAGPQGQVLRQELLDSAMKSLKKYIVHAETYLDKVVEEINKAGTVQTWAFWSGAGAQHAARREAGRGVVLEGSIGSWFDSVWDFKALTGVENLPLWAAMSELYAKKAAENYRTFKFIGFLGAGATRDQSVFNKIEQPTFIEVLNVRERVAAPEVEWFVVDCVERSPGRWEGSGKPSIPVSSRAEGLRLVKERYGG